jgi:hypothetical protein
VESASDRARIEAVLTTWSTCIDRREVDRLREEVLAEDVRIDMGYGVWQGAEAAVAALEGVVSRFEASAHALTNFRFRRDGEEMRCSSYVTAWHWARDAGVDPSRHVADFVTVGVYLDRLRRESRGWRIVEQRVRRLGPSAIAIGTLPDYIRPAAG